jgi:predicted ATPase
MQIPILQFTTVNNNLSITDGFDLPQYTILVWKNNSGKSHLLRTLAIKIEPKITPRSWGSDQYRYQKLKARYVTPERWWYFQREATFEDKNAKEKYSSR